MSTPMYSNRDIEIVRTERDFPRFALCAVGMFALCCVYMRVMVRVCMSFDSFATREAGSSLIYF